MIGKIIKKIFFIFFALLLSVILLDIGLRIIAGLRERIDKENEVIDPKILLSSFKDVDWAEKYFQENKASGQEDFFPFYEWRTKEFHGEFINVDDQGRRKTWNLEDRDIKQNKKIFCFGGSTMWGHGVRDDFTIPSLLSRRFAEDRRSDLYFVNYGENAYTFTQELIYLILLLKKGIVPDYVIFYDGVNECLSAAQNKKAGLTINLNDMREKLHYKKPSYIQMFLKGLSGIIERDSQLIKLVKGLRDKYGKNNIGKDDIDPIVSNEEVESLAMDVVSDYKSNVDLLERLSSSYGFKYFLFWQPAVFLTDPLTEEEKSFDLWQDRFLVELYKQTYNRIRQEAGLLNSFDLSPLLDNKNKSLYIDFCHLNEEGNAIIAEQVYTVLKDKL
ncbi:MAG: SGNH/GDSL hydrolase family protein [Candidatus Omnitrophota bacterium]